MFGIVIAVNDDFTKSIMHMYISAPLTHKILQDLSNQTKTIPVKRA
jgi:hypothetical protein